jgi:RNA polymerase sigma-70 factor (ECF subfamily)
MDDAASRTLDPLDPASELALVRRIAAQDREALASLYHAYARRLQRFVGRMTRRADVIDEAVNDSFWVVWNKAGDFRGDARVSTWLMGIAYRCALRVLRQHGPHSADDLDSMDSRDHAAHDPRTAHETSDWLAKGLAQLSEPHRLVLDLAYGGGHSVEEIAAILQCPVGTVKARMFHARMKLRNLLPALAGEPPQAAQGGTR